MLKQGQQIILTHLGEKEIIQDKKILRNVLLNLLSNAIKYSQADKTIHLTIEIKNNLVSIKVKDEGIGIPQDEQKNLFGKFYRAMNVTNIQGTGLGLNIVKRYLELLDGTISFISEPGNGTTFTIEFPKISD
jgi:signal transduction histidine kinase